MTIQMPTLDRFERGLGQMEKGLNIAGVVPIVHILTGVSRHVLGYLQMITAVALGCMYGLAQLLSKTNKDRYAELSRRSFEHVTHGAANFARGLIEYLPLGGIALCLVYDYALEKRMQYEGEQNLVAAAAAS